ncbi:hypothetical protein BSN85_35240 [Bradyrhizobium brasilense]|uniref:hypothetical protein n=1 Tax=Bradyrhizobium brasilense TaxID=1419277 RepID=UPI000976E91D|nr:hypothetical protein [Bradyrhizobium brasilense]OMI00056.1 hypothetical protein BSN85_35240 [Bradyrhizobium brasilense]
MGLSNMDIVPWAAAMLEVPLVVIGCFRRRSVAIAMTICAALALASVGFALGTGAAALEAMSSIGVFMIGCRMMVWSFRNSRLLARDAIGMRMSRRAADWLARNDLSFSATVLKQVIHSLETVLSLKP